MNQKNLAQDSLAHMGQVLVGVSGALKLVFKSRRCVYSFSKKDLKLSDSETYNCTVAACGRYCFGMAPNRTL